MHKNNKPSQLDQGHIIRQTFDCDNDSVRTSIVGDINLAINSSVDSISIGALPSSIKVNVPSNTIGVILGPISCVGMKTFCAVSSLANNDLKIEISPSDRDDVWLNLENCPIGRRVRVVNTIASAQMDVYLVMQGN